MCESSLIIYWIAHTEKYRWHPQKTCLKSWVFSFVLISTPLVTFKMFGSLQTFVNFILNADECAEEPVNHGWTFTGRNLKRGIGLSLINDKYPTRATGASQYSVD